MYVDTCPPWGIDLDPNCKAESCPFRDIAIDFHLTWRKALLAFRSMLMLAHEKDHELVSDFLSLLSSLLVARTRTWERSRPVKRASRLTDRICRRSCRMIDHDWRCRSETDWRNVRA